MFFEKTYAEMSNNVFYGLVTGAVIIGVVGIYSAVSYINRAPTQSDTTEIKSLPPTDKPLEEPKKIIADSHHASLVSSIATNSMAAIEREKMLKNIKFAVSEDEKSWHYYLSLEDAIEKLQTFTSPNLVFKIGFPSKLVLEHKTKEELSSWLARLGDYIYATRFSLVEDTTDVVRHEEFFRAQAQEITECGMVIFSEDKDVWWVEIRGLENFVDEIKKVAGFIEKAITNPEAMSPCADFSTQDFSSKISLYFLSKKQRDFKALNDKEVSLVDDLVYFSHANSRGCLLESDFSEAENITDSQGETLKAEMNNFIINFNREFLPVIGEQPDSERAQKIAVRGACYAGFVVSEKRWVIKTELSKILEESLFIK